MENQNTTAVASDSDPKMGFGEVLRLMDEFRSVQDGIPSYMVELRGKVFGVTLPRSVRYLPRRYPLHSIICSSPDLYDRLLAGAKSKREGELPYEFDAIYLVDPCEAGGFLARIVTEFRQANGDPFPNDLLDQVETATAKLFFNPPI